MLLYIAICICIVTLISLVYSGYKESEKARLQGWEAEEREIQKWCEENGEEYT